MNNMTHEDMMQEKLEQAAQQGLLTREQVLPLVTFLNKRIDPTELPSSAYLISDDEERIQFVGGFNDIFVSIGVFLLAGAFVLLRALVGDGFSYTLYLLSTVLISIGLSELFSRKLSLALSSSVLSLCFAAAVGIFFYNLFGLDINLTEQNPVFLVAGSLAAASAVYGHYYRYRVAIDISLVVACVIASIFIMARKLVISLDGVAAYGYMLTGFAGIATLFIALCFDSRDPLRRTQNADVAFWLHLLAAPLIVHSFFWASGLLKGLRLSTINVGSSFSLAIVGILLMFILFGVIAIIIDRRAMLISGLSYCGFAIYNTFETVSTSPRGVAFGATFLFLGAGVVILGFGWRPIRRVLLKLVPEHKRHLLPPV